MPIGLIISIAIILGTFEACYNQVKRCEEFLREKEKECGADEAGTTEEHTEINQNN